MKWISRRSALRMGLMGGACGAPYSYGATFGRSEIVVENSSCPLPAQHARLDGLRIAAMADFHFDETHDEALVEEAVSLCNAEDPHVVLLPGDFVSKDPLAARPLAGQLGNIRARLGVFASTGNHDHWSGVEVIGEALRSAGIDVLRNESRVLDYDGQSFAVVGLDSVWGGRPDHRAATRDLPADLPRILSMHEPDYFDDLAGLAKPRPILQVSGHTHGGQVCAPFVGPLRLPSWGKKYPAGPYGEGDAQLYVNRGIGTIGPNARFFCRPEVSLITLKA